MTYFDSGKEIVDVGPVQVERDVLEVIQRLHDYDPNLEVLILRERSADFADAPYMIVENCSDGLKRKVFSCWELTTAILERVVQADSRRTDVLGNLERAEEQLRRDARRRYQEVREEARDVMKHVLNHSGSRYSFPDAFGNTVTLDDTVGIIKRGKK